MLLPTFEATRTEAQQLRPYQTDALRAIVQAWEQHETPLIVMATGLGKTTVIAELLVREFDPATQRALVIAHTQELIWQPKERIEQQFGGALSPYYGPEFKPGIGVVMAANDDVSARIIVATRQSLREARFKRVLEHGAIDILIIDECFPSGTLVDGRPIESFKVGDSVTAYNELTGELTPAKVTHVFTKPVGDNLIRIRAGGNTITCTPNHPILTLSGWKTACSITNSDMVQCTISTDSESTNHVNENTNPDGDNLPAMWQRHSVRHTTKTPEVSAEWRKGLLFEGVRRGFSQGYLNSTPDGGNVLHLWEELRHNNQLSAGSTSQIGASVLLSSMQHSVSCEGQRRNDGEDEPQTCIGENEGTQPDAQRIFKNQNADDATRYGLEAPATGRQWYVHSASNVIGECVGVADGVTDYHELQTWQSRWDSSSLQSGHRERDFENSNRSGRVFPSKPESKRSRREKRSNLAWVGVDSVEILESNGDSEFGGVCPKGLVYNLEVNPHNTYLANNVVVHNCHHVAAGSTYLDIVEFAKTTNPNVRIVGFTATPKRTDKKALGALFSKISYNYGIVPAIRDGWLSPATRIKVKTPVDLRKVEKTAGDYKVDKLIAVLDAANWVQLAVDAYKKHVLDTGRQCLAFFPGVMESIQFTAALQAEGIPAAHVDANTPKDQRVNMLRDYKQNKLKVVSNMGVLTEGFDAAQTSAILMARPTKSETLFTQIIGRGLRIYPNKKDCLIIDLTFTDTNVLTVGSLLGELQTCHNPECLTEFYRGLKHCPQCGWVAKRAAVKLCPECEAELPQNAKVCTECGYLFLTLPRDPDEGKTEQGEGLVEEIASLFSGLGAAWHQGQDGWLSCGIGEQGAMVIAPPSYQDGSRLRERLQRGMNLLHYIEEDLREELLSQIGMLERMLKRAEQYTLWFAPKWDYETPAHFRKPVEFIRGNADLASLVAEADVEVLMRAGEQKNLVKKNTDWRLMPPSLGQVNFMQKLRITIPDGCTKGEAASLITHTLALRDVEKFIAQDVLPEPVVEVE